MDKDTVYLASLITGYSVATVLQIPLQDVFF